MAADLHLGKESSNVQLVKALTETFAKKVDLQLRRDDQHHRHLKETHEAIRDSRMANVQR